MVSSGKVWNQNEAKWITSKLYRLINVWILDLFKLNLVKLVYRGKVLGSSWFSLLPQLSQKMKLDSKMFNIDSKIIISLHNSKFVTQSVNVFGQIEDSCLEKLHLETSDCFYICSLVCIIASVAVIIETTRRSIKCYLQLRLCIPVRVSDFGIFLGNNTAFRKKSPKFPVYFDRQRIFENWLFDRQK